MQPAGTSDRYTFVAIAFHWAMAIGIVALVVIGLVMTHLKADPMRAFRLYQLHKSIGITVLMTAILRLGWRFYRRPPPLPQAMPQLEKRAASLGHLLLYIFLFALPMTGWALVSASVLNIPTVLYGIIPWPHLPVLATLSNKAPVEALLKHIHTYGAYALVAVVSLHIAAALRHHFIIGDDVLTRMLPLRRKSSARPAL